MEKKDLDKWHQCNTIVYTIRWNLVKSARLKRTRGVSFEEIVEAKLVGIREHPNRDDQHLLIFDYRGYIWIVPFIMEEESIFLKTLYPSRKYQKLYKKR